MNARTKTGLQILQVALVIGVAGDIFLLVDPWGLGVTMFNVVFVAGMMTVLYRRAPEQLTWQTLVLFAAQLFFASMFAWRDSIELRIADGLAILTILSVLFLPKLKVSTSTARLKAPGRSVASAIRPWLPSRQARRSCNAVSACCDNSSVP